MKPKRDRSSQDPHEKDRVVNKTAKITKSSEAEQAMFLSTLKVVVPKAAVSSVTFENDDRRLKLSTKFTTNDFLIV